MKTEEQIKNRMKSCLLHSFNNESLTEKMQAKAEILSWVLEMSTDDYFKFWDAIEEEYEGRQKV